MRQFAQRVTATCHIRPFDLPDTIAYIRHRLEVAGGRGTEFSAAAIRSIFEETDGIPRMINKLCDLALVYAATAELKMVGLETVREVLEDGLVLSSYKSPLFLTNRIDQPEEAAE